MLIKRTVSIISPSTLVKTFGRTTAIVLAASTLGFATQASAFGGPMVDRVVTVKLKKSELMAPDGVPLLLTARVFFEVFRPSKV